MLDVRDLSKSYGAVDALVDVSFAAARGSVTALLGENGAGKSTLVKILSGLVVPTRGTISLDGAAIDTTTPDRARRSGVAVVQQEISVLPNLTVAENFMLAGRDALLDRRRAAAACRPFLDRLGLEHLDSRRPVEELTIGERQLVEIARMLSQDAQVLVLDEPTAALSDHDIALVHRAVRRLASEGKVVLYITHRLNELAEICDRAVVLRNGRLVDECDAAGASLGRIVHSMIGRELAELYPARPAPRPPAEPALRLAGLLTPGLAAPVSLDVAPGEIVAASGQLGSGFVEPLRAAAGVARILAGEVVLGGRAIRPRAPGDSVGAGIAYCSDDRQLDGFFANRPSWESLSAPGLAAAGLWGLTRAAALRRGVDAIAERMTIPPAYRGRPVRALSGGNAQKVAIGKWLSREPRLLLLEEPTRGVDVGARAEIYRLLRALADDGLSILVASTDIDEVLGFGERVLLFHDRRLIHQGPAAAMTRDQAVTLITHGTDEGVAA